MPRRLIILSSVIAAFVIFPLESPAGKAGKTISNVTYKRGQFVISYKALNIVHLQKHHSGVAQTIQMSSLYLNILAEFRQLYNLIVNISTAVVDFKKAQEMEA